MLVPQGRGEGWFFSHGRSLWGGRRRRGSTHKRASPGVTGSKNLSHQERSRCPGAQSKGVGGHPAPSCLWLRKPGWKKQLNGSDMASRSCAGMGRRLGCREGRGSSCLTPCSCTPSGIPLLAPTPAGETQQASPQSVFGKYQVLLDRLMFKLTVLFQCTQSRASMWGCVQLPPSCDALRQDAQPPGATGIRSWGFLAK